MSKERLEEIKKELELDWSDISYVVNQDDVKWLIEQAKRVQELEEEVDRLNGALHFQLSEENIKNERIRKLHRQNRRYREAIERALGESGWGDEGNALYRTIGILTKALEGEE